MNFIKTVCMSFMFIQTVLSFFIRGSKLYSMPSTLDFVSVRNIKMDIFTFY